MSLAAKIESEGRWRRTLESPDGLAEDLGSLGVSVGPRTGPTRRTHGEKEDYVLRRLLIAWKKKENLRFPVDVQAASEATAPDFVLYWPDGETRGVEVTEAGKEDYQAWMTTVESKIGSGKTVSLPFDESIKGTAAEILDVIRKKVGKAKKGQYRDPEDCDLLVYDNTAWGGFLDGRELLDALGRPKDLVGPFRQIHLVEGAKVHLDIFGQRQSVDISKEYETDYAGWITEQAERLRDGATDKLDLAHLADQAHHLPKTPAVDRHQNGVQRDGRQAAGEKAEQQKAKIAGEHAGAERYHCLAIHGADGDRPAYIADHVRHGHR